MEQVANCCKAALAQLHNNGYYESIMKAFFRFPIVREIIARLLAFYMFLVKITTKWERIGEENLYGNLEPNKGLVACMWHSRINLIPSIFDLRRCNVSMLFSLSKDGDITTRVGELMSFNIIRGSTAKKRDDKIEDKGGIAAFRAMLLALKKGHIVALTPDGPSGPRLKMSMGAVRTAKTGGAYFVPITASIRQSRIAKSWDRLLFPRFFKSGIIIYGQPILVDAQNEEEFELARKKCEDALNSITYQADELCGLEIVKPEESNFDA